MAASGLAADARDGNSPSPARPADVETLKAYDVLERHCARCHQSGKLQKRGKPAAEFGNVLRLDEVARDAHFVRPGNPDASRLYTLMLRRHMPYDVYYEGASQEPPSADDIDVMRSWIAGLKPEPSVCAGRRVISNDALQIAIAQDVERLPGEVAARVRYLSLVNHWNACAGEPYLAAARKAATVLLSGLSRGPRPPQVAPINTAETILRIDLDGMQWTPEEWDRLSDLAPYTQPSAFATTSRGPSVSLAVLAAVQPIRLDWLAFLLSEEARKRTAQTPGLSAEMRKVLQDVWSGPSGLSKMRQADPAAFQVLLGLSGLDPVPSYDQIEMIDHLARTYMRDVGPERAAAEIGIDATELLGSLKGGQSDIQRLMLQLAQGAVSRASFERSFGIATGHLLGLEAPSMRESFGIGALGHMAARSAQPFTIEMTADKSNYRRDEAVNLLVRSESDCHLTLVSVSPSGRAVVLLPNDWDRSTFLPAGKEQKFPREDSPFRLRLDTPGWETVVAGCNPAAPVFDGILHDFNLEKFTSLGDYRRFLMRVSEGTPMMTPPTPQGERKAAPKRQARGAKNENDRGKPDPAARTAIRFEVQTP
jgi:mono/diheme cytochrome c family protein